MTIEITFTVDDTKIKIATYNNDSVEKLIDNLEPIVKRGCEVKVFIYDTDSTNSLTMNLNIPKNPSSFRENGC